MLIILSTLIDTMLAQARRDHPLETCGLISGPLGSDRPLRMIPMRNDAQSPDFFRFDSREQLNVWRDLETRGEEPVVIYHSHTHSPAYPSRDDIALAAEPHAHYVIVSTDPAAPAPVRSFRIAGGTVMEESIRTVARYADAGAVPSHS
ncbi:M67 family metallopeptidase [Burkholderia alba]|uniref:M67 family metallopeptidase n=1 Tax=Burkholderia alba TaxID=2683677 RepID=UPI002B0576D8|nr:M67 family metallopeptidase [Burkholderia alba]